MLADLTIQKFMEELSSGSPVPGGGSVSALCGVTASALSAMVASLTEGRKGYEDAWEEMKSLKRDMEKAGEELMTAMDEDAKAYAKVIECFKLPKGTEEEKQARSEAIQEATKEAALVPLSVAEKTAVLFDAAEAAVRNGNQNAISDGAVAAMMARTGVLSALQNVRINAISLKDDKERKALLERAYALEKLANKREKEILSLLTF